jgi:hypothetical protein
LGHTIDRWKGIIEEIHFGGSIKAFKINIEVPIPKKICLGPQNGPKSLEPPEKLLKIVNCQKKSVLNPVRRVEKWTVLDLNQSCYMR